MSRMAKGKGGFNHGTLMNDREIKSRRAADAKRADKGMMKEMGKARETRGRAELTKLRAASKPLDPPAVDPHADLVKAGGLNPNEPSVESDEPTLVQMQRARQQWGR